MGNYFKNQLRRIGAGLSVFLLLAVSVLTVPVVAETKTDSLLFGQRHYYSVIFRGNGEAIVYAKLVVTNPEDEPMKKFAFQIPVVEPYEMSVYQMELPKVCANYDYSGSKRECLRYRDPDYDSYYYYRYSGDEDATYTKIKYEKTDQTYTLELPKAVEPHKTTAIILTYAGKGYVTKSVGTMKFAFETPKVASRIQEINVAVDVDSDLVLRGKKTQIDYGDSNSGIKSGATLDAANMSSVELDRLQNQIGRYGVVQKEAKNLAPNESMIVRGEYATSWLKLYLRQTLLSLAVIAAIVAGSIFLSKWWRRRRASKAKPAGDKPKVKAESASEEMVYKSKTKLAPLPFHRHVIIGLISAGLTLALIAISVFAVNIVALQFIFYTPILALLALLLVILLFASIIFGPVIYIGFKHGWRQGLKLFAFEFAWLVVLAIIAAIFVALSSNGQSPSYYPQYYYD